MTTDPTMRTPSSQELTEQSSEGPSTHTSGYVNMSPGMAFGYSPPNAAEIRRERVEGLAVQLLLERVRQGHTSVDPAECAKQAKALYAELDREDEGTPATGERA